MQRITFERLIGKLTVLPETIEREVGGALREAAVKVHKSAVEKFGTYQPAVGPFEGWALLTLQTLHQKMDLAGASGPDPLIGHYEHKGGNFIYPVSLRQSLTMQIDVHNMCAFVGTNNPLGEIHEFGTVHIPPRPFLRPALYQNQNWIKNSMKEALGLGMIRWVRVGAI